MADFPSTTATDRSNAQTATQEVVIDAPDFDASRSAEERWLDQQWRDADAAGLGKRHPLSINRDSSYVTSDPYTP